jgi:hypothetical protein
MGDPVVGRSLESVQLRLLPRQQIKELFLFQIQKLFFRQGVQTGRCLMVDFSEGLLITTYLFLGDYFS